MKNLQLFSDGVIRVYVEVWIRVQLEVTCVRLRGYVHKIRPGNDDFGSIGKKAFCVPKRKKIHT